MVERFKEIYNKYITREGADRLLEYLCTTDFFTAPASTRFHNSFEGGLLSHSLNVYKCLKAYLEREIMTEEYGVKYSDETVAIAGLLHDVCKVNCYKPGTRNVKENGVWKQVPTYEVEDSMPYGHGEKSVYIINGFMRLTREEAFAIRYHMGFSNAANSEQINNVGRAFEMFPLALALNVADMEASYFLEGSI